MSLVLRDRIFFSLTDNHKRGLSRHVDVLPNRVNLARMATPATPVPLAPEATQVKTAHKDHRVYQDQLAPLESEVLQVLQVPGASKVYLALQVTQALTAKMEKPVCRVPEVFPAVLVFVV